MATQAVINSNATRGISILIDQPQQQAEIIGSQQQQQQQQQRHATAKINISPVATLTTKTLITTTTTTTTPYAPASTTSSAYSSLGSDEQSLPQASQSSSTSMTTVNGNQQHHTNNNKNYSTTFIDINCQDAADDVGADQILRTGSESQKSTATFPHSLLRVAAAATTAATSQVSSQEQVNKCVAITTTTVTTTTTRLSGERRKTQTAAASEPTAAAAATVKAENGERVGQLGQSVAISITHERDNNKSSSGIQLHHKANDDDDVVTTRPTTKTTTTTIIACNSSSSSRTQTNINDNDDDDGDDHDGYHDNDDVAEDEHGYKNNHHDVVAVAHDAIVESLRRRSHLDRCLSSDVAQVVVSAVATTATGAAATTGTSSLPTSQRPEQLENIVTQTLNHRLELADCASALTESVDSNAVKDSHVVKIKISPTSNGAAKPSETHHHQHSHEQPPKVDEQKRFSVFSDKLNSIGENNHFAKVSRVHLQNDSVVKNGADTEPQHETRIENIKLKINDKMVQKPSGTVTATTTPSPTAQVTTNSGNTTVTELNVSNPSAYLYYMMSSGQFSPCDTLDSGTGSDLESNGNGNGNGHRKISANNNNNNSSNSSHKMSSNSAPNKLELHLKTTKIRMHAVGVGGAGGDKQHHSSVTSNGDHQRAGSLTDSEESESSLSCDSINSSDYLRHSSNSPTNGHHHHLVVVPKAPPTPTSLTPPGKSSLATFLPDSLLRDIRDRKFPTNDFIAKYVDNNHDDRRGLYDAIEESVVADTHNGNASLEYQVVESHVKYARSNSGNMTNITTNQRMSLPNKTFVLNTADGTFVDTKMNSMPRTYEADKYYDFHVNEHDNFRSFGGGGGGSACGDGSEIGDTCSEAGSWIDYEPRALHEDAFAGYKDIRCVSAASTIRSSKGTVRGVRNRVRNGIATFLQLQQPNIKNFKEKDHGKVVLYTTSMGIIRDTYAKCSNMKQILRTLLIKFEERDVFMSVEYQQEIKARMHSEVIKVPQLFVEGQHIGDAETVERLNESGELRQLLKPYKSISTTYTCQTCGGYRLLPCPSCNGSKKSVHRNHFTAEFVALKCMNCDEVGLVKCHNC